MSPYMQYPCFLSRALAFARLSQYETMVMAYVTEQSYSLSKTQVVHINQSNLARLFGVLRQRIQEAVTSLQKSNILVTADQGLSINPTFQEWVRPDLDWSEDRVNWIMATARQGVHTARYSVQSDTCNSTVQRAGSTVQRAGSTVQRAIETSESETCTPDCAPPARQTVHPLHGTACTPSDIPPDPPNRNARGIESRETEEENTHTEDACVGVRVEYENAEDEPFVPTAPRPIEAPKPKSEYDARIDRACARLKEIATKRTGNEDFGDSVSQGVSRFMAEGYGAAEIEAALAKALNTLVPQGKHQLHWHKYVTSTLQGMQGSNSGGPAPRRGTDSLKVNAESHKIYRAPKDEDLSQYVPVPEDLRLKFLTPPKPEARPLIKPVRSNA